MGIRKVHPKHNPFGAGGLVGRGTTMTIGAETGGNTINVAIQFKNDNAIDCGERVSCFAYLSDDANGDSVAATAPSGGVAVNTDGVVVPVVAGKAFHFISEADGDLDIDIVEAGADTWYLVLVMPDGGLLVSDAITFA